MPREHSGKSRGDEVKMAHIESIQLILLAGNPFEGFWLPD